MALQRLGQINNTGLSNALFAKLFLTEVIAAFDEYVVFDKLLTSRTIPHGKSVSFPVTWKTNSQYFIPGVSPDLLGNNNVGQNEIVVNVDSVLESDILIPQIDELQNHWDVRQEFAKQMGQAIARTEDQQLAQLAILCARDTTDGQAGITGVKGSANQRAVANMDTDATVLTAALFYVAQKYAENYIPLDNVTAVFKPAQYYLLAQNSTIQSRFFNPTTSPLVSGMLPPIADIPIFKSNNLPNGVVIPTQTGTNNVYSGDFTNTVGVVFDKSAVGTVKLQGLTTEQVYMPWKQATLMIAKMAVGHGILRPIASWELEHT